MAKKKIDKKDVEPERLLPKIKIEKSVVIVVGIIIVVTALFLLAFYYKDHSTKFTYNNVYFEKPSTQLL